MKALTILPRTANSARLDEIAEPPGAGPVLVRTHLIGICGTDHELLGGAYGNAPAGAERLIIGHESLGVVEEAPAGCGLAAGDLVVGIVRRPDPVPCAACAAGEWDMCRNGQYTERGIKARHGFAAERFRIEPDFAVKIAPELGSLGVLLEPASVVAKAWDQIERIGRRSASWRAHRVLVTGAGPIGLLGALMAQQRGFDVHVYDHNTGGTKAKLVRDLGATYHSDDLRGLKALEADVVLECTGAPSVVVAVTGLPASDGIVCLAGLSGTGELNVDVGLLNMGMVLRNEVVFGTVNANRAHFEAGAAALAAADPGWLGRVISRRVAIDDWRQAFQRQPDDIKVVLAFAA